MTMGLTEVQSKCFVFIRDRIGENGVAPSCEEIRQHLNLNNRGRVPKILKALCERGAIRRLPHRARAIEICETSGIAVEPHPEVRSAIEAYAKEHGITVKTAAEEALRAYFMGPWHQ